MLIKRNLFKDILRDTNSKKYSMTKFAAFIAVGLLIFAVGAGIWIMVENKRIDYFLIGELIAFILTLLGFKNSKDKRELDLKRQGMVKQQQTNTEIIDDNLKGNERDKMD